MNAPITDDHPKALTMPSCEKFLDEFDGDEALMQRMIGLFAENELGLLDDIRGSLARRGSNDLARSAQTKSLRRESCA